jgi:hypothetical protein
LNVQNATKKIPSKPATVKMLSGKENEIRPDQVVEFDNEADF